MSIINDALKKVQKNLDKKRHSEDNQSSTPSEPEQPKKEIKQPPMNEPNQSSPEVPPVHGYVSKDKAQPKPIQPEPAPPIPEETKKEPEQQLPQAEPPPKEEPTPAPVNTPQPDEQPETLKATTPPPPTPAPDKKTTKESSPSKHLSPIVIVVCIVLFGFGIALGIRLFNNTSTPITAPRQIKQPPRIEGLVVSGIMIMPDKNVALINGEIYEVGDTINGMKIDQITLDHVILLDGDKAITLTKQ